MGRIYRRTVVSRRFEPTRKVLSAADTALGTPGSVEFGIIRG